MAVINYPSLSRLINTNKTWNATINFCINVRSKALLGAARGTGREGEADKQAEEANLNYCGCIYRAGLAVLLQIYQIMERIE